VVQTRLAEFDGSQCGFCTPGIVMALHSLFQQNKDLKVADVEEHFDGNLCRCTGYRPIWDAAKSLCSDGFYPRPATMQASGGRGDALG
jgi:xanthine dehydrogenase/oxidase